MPNRVRHLAANLALVLASSLAALVVLELGVRILQPQPLAAVSRSARLGWMHRPNSTIVYQREEFRVATHFSSAGLRDRDYPFEKPPGTFRIAYLGDSFVEALQVPQDSCAAKRLEVLLNAAGGTAERYEVLNFGVSGYGTCQQLLLLDDLVWRFEPDLVLSQLYYNDLDDDRRFGACQLDAGRDLVIAPQPKLSFREHLASTIKSFLFQHSHLWMFVTTRKPRTGNLSATNPQASPEPSRGTSDTAVPSCTGRHASLEWRLTLRDPPEDAQRAVDLYAEILRHMQDECHEHGAGFLGVLGVSKTQLEPEIYARTLVTEGCRAEAHDVDLPAERLRAACAARGVQVLDLVPAFRAHAGGPKLHFRFDGHWTSAGHAVAAAALCEALSAHAMLGAVRPSEPGLRPR